MIAGQLRFFISLYLFSLDQMNKYLFLLFLFAMGGLVSCTQTNDVNLLKQAETCVESDPDNALQLLNLLENSELLRGKESADYALLLTQALDKNYLDSLQSDSLIKIAVDYYKGSGDYVKAGKSYYYYGKIMVVKGKVSEAMEAFLKALTFLKETKEYKLQGLIFEHIGYLNLGQGMYEQSIDNYRKSIHYYELAGDSIGEVYGCRNVARGHYASQDYDSAYWYANRGLLLLSDTTNQVRSSLFQLLGLIVKDEGKYSQAIDYFISAIESNKNVNDGLRYYLSLGCAYMDIGQFALAERCFEHCKNVNDVFISSGAYNYLYLLKKKESNYEQALSYKELSDSILNIVRNNELSSQLLALQKKYEADRLIMENSQIRLEKENQAYFYSVIMLIISGVSFWLIKRYKKKNLRNIEALRRNERILKEYACRITGLELEGEQEREAKKEVIGKLNRKILELTSENKRIRDNSCVEALFVLGELKEGKLIVENMKMSERQSIFDFLDLVYANFVSRIKTDFELTKGDLLLAALIKLGFSSKQLMIVFDCEMKSVYKSKQRLKSHLKLEKEDSLEEMIAFY
jgi:tetratricopeptide (TPR) repeat protein